MDYQNRRGDIRSGKATVSAYSFLPSFMLASHFHERFASPHLRDPVSPFISMLWERGSLYESEVVAELGYWAVSQFHRNFGEYSELQLIAQIFGIPEIKT
jgi:hypothetical protein